MPTTSLPGMGASMRIERAARAIARSSARASMRETLTWCSGWTSYWVTTGPELTATTLAGMAKLSSFSSMRRLLVSWSTPAPTRPAARGSSRSVPGSTQSIARSDSRPVGRRRVATAVATRGVPMPCAGRDRPRRPTAVARSPVQTVWLTGAWPVRGAGSSRMLRAAARAPWPSAPGPATCRRRPWRRRHRSSRARPRSAGAPPGAPHRVAVVSDPAGRAGHRVDQLAQPEVEGEHQPEDRHRDPQHERARPVSSGSSVPARKRPMRPPPRSVLEASTSRTSNAPEDGDVGDGQAEQGHPPARPGLPARSARRRTSRRPGAGTGAASGRSRTTGRSSRATSRSGRPRRGGSGRSA